MTEQTAKQSPVNVDFEALKAQAEAHLKGWQRAQADYQNLKKQTDKERLEIAAFANAALMVELFPVYDNLKLAVQHMPQENPPEWAVGFKHILSQLQQIFSHHGLMEIPTVGTQFDPSVHEAVAQDTQADKADHEVLEEVSTGFRLNDRVLRPAKVKVNTAPQSTTN